MNDKFYFAEKYFDNQEDLFKYASEFENHFPTEENYNYLFEFLKNDFWTNIEMHETFKKSKLTNVELRKMLIQMFIMGMNMYLDFKNEK